MALEKRIDPVCGMEVDPDKPAGTCTYRGITYYFCSLACKKEFDANRTKLLMHK